jgi:plastocyanin
VTTATTAARTIVVVPKPKVGSVTYPCRPHRLMGMTGTVDVQ